MLYKKIVLWCILTIMAGGAYACDICGCGVGGYYIGLLPDFKKRFIGLRYQYKQMRTHLSPGGGTSYLTSDESYHIAELWGGWDIGKKVRILGFVPVNFIERENQGSTTYKNGIGDIAVTGYYQVLNNTRTAGKKLLVQSLWVGGGVKLPTGAYSREEKELTENSSNNFQLGTGSLDFTFNAMYDIRLQDAGINTNVSYKVNTTNDDHYRYGNKFTANVLAYYKINIAGKVSLAPNAGILYENAAQDTDEGKFSVDASGGYACMGQAGVEAAYKRISVGANMQTPFSQDLANGMVRSGNRMMVHVTLLF